MVIHPTSLSYRDNEQFCLISEKVKYREFIISQPLLRFVFFSSGTNLTMIFSFVNAGSNYLIYKGKLVLSGYECQVMKE